MLKDTGLSCTDQLKLSQAAAHPRRGTNITRNGISCKECATCYTTREEKAKEKNLNQSISFTIFIARNDASVSSAFECTDDTEERVV
jgi:hypothetical protein